jgi:hypothetical protein
VTSWLLSTQVAVQETCKCQRHNEYAFKNHFSQESDRQELNIRLLFKASHSFPLFILVLCITHRWHAPEKREQQIDASAIYATTAHPSDGTWKYVQFHISEDLRVNDGSIEMSLDNLDSSSLVHVVLFVDSQNGCKFRQKPIPVFVTKFLDGVVGVVRVEYVGCVVQNASKRSRVAAGRVGSRHATDTQFSQCSVVRQ